MKPLAIGALIWLAALSYVLMRIDAQGQLHLTPFPSTSCPTPTLGVNSTLAYEGYGPRRDATVAAIRARLGAQIVRDSLLWNEIQPTQDKPDWTLTDSMVKELRTAGVEPLLVVMGSPPWANGMPASKRQHDLYVPPRGPKFSRWLTDYSNFVLQAVRRYHVVVKHWEIWNEPNTQAFWQPYPDPLTYRLLYETLRSTILRVDPQAEVAVGGLTSISQASAPDITGLQFLRRLLYTRPALGPVAIHPYPTDDHAPDVRVAGENNFQDIERVHDLLVSEHEQAAIWLTEWGWSSATVGRQLQARYLNKSLEMLETHYPFVTIATYFIDHDLPPRFSQGLLDEYLRPKPAASVFRRYSERLTARCRPRTGA